VCSVAQQYCMAFQGYCVHAKFIVLLLLLLLLLQV
jgi:hypothetical protein